MLPHHFYIQKLLDIKNINKHSDPDIPPCKVCMADSVDKVRERVARAKWFCQNCSELLCEDCCKAHKYMRTPHVLKVLTHELNQKLRQRVCGKHPEEFNDIYCWECDKNVCRSCVQEEHKRHSTLNIREAEEGTRNEITACKTEMSMVVTELDKLAETCSKEVEFMKEQERGMKERISSAAQKQKQVIDEQLSELYIRYDRTTELGESTREMAEITSKDIVKFVEQCDQLMDKGTAMDVVRSGRQLHQEAAHLKQRYTAITIKRPGILTFTPADVTAQLVDQLASSATANQLLNSEGALTL